MHSLSTTYNRYKTQRFFATNVKRDKIILIFANSVYVYSFSAHFYNSPLIFNSVCLLHKNRGNRRIQYIIQHTYLYKAPKQEGDTCKIQTCLYNYTLIHMFVRRRRLEIFIRQNKVQRYGKFIRPTVGRRHL